MSEYHLSPFPSHPNYLGNLTLDQANAYYELSKHLLLRRNLPERQQQLLMLNESGGRVDKTDPRYGEWERKQKKYSKDDPRRIPFTLRDVIAAEEAYGPFMEMLEQSGKGDNPFDDVPMAALLEIQEGLEARSFPNWFYSTLPLDKLREAIGQESTTEQTSD